MSAAVSWRIRSVRGASGLRLRLEIKSGGAWRWRCDVSDVVRGATISTVTAMDGSEHAMKTNMEHFE